MVFNICLFSRDSPPSNFGRISIFSNHNRKSSIHIQFFIPWIVCWDYIFVQENCHSQNLPVNLKLNCGLSMSKFIDNPFGGGLGITELKFVWSSHLSSGFLGTTDHHLKIYPLNILTKIIS